MQAPLDCRELLGYSANSRKAAAGGRESVWENHALASSQRKGLDSPGIGTRMPPVTFSLFLWNKWIT